jgi:hypothetical protein
MKREGIDGLRARDDLREPLMASIEEAELVRERGETERALESLCAIRAKAAKDGDLEAVGLASAHIVVCYKHLYQKTGAAINLLKMETESEQALALPLPDRLKAVFWMRRADVACERREFDQAEVFGQRGYDLVEKHSYAEVDCLGRLAHAKTMSGKFTEAESFFARATDILAGMPSHRTFHRVTVESGLLARRTKLALNQKRYASAVRHFIRGYLLAWEYRIRYGMPQRVKQYHRGLWRAISSILRLGGRS